MGEWLTSSVGVVLAATTLAIGAGCTHRDDDGAIKPAPEQQAPATSAETPSPPPVTAVPEPPVANPLAMGLKHDERAPAASPAPSDPCARPEPTGPLSMRLRHGSPTPPGQRNPLCMRIK